MKKSIVAAGIGAALLCTPAFAAEELVTQPFRDEHVVIWEHLGHIQHMIEMVEGLMGEEAREPMQRVVDAYESHIASHAQWEEENLYPVVDRLAGAGDYTFTASMVHEHRIVGRWIDELRAIQTSAQPDGAVFVQKASMLLGLISAHFEVEEEVLLPVLDSQMSQEEFEHEVLSKMEGHAH